MVVKKAAVVILILVLMAGSVYAGTTSVHVTKRYDLDFPKSRCGGHGETGVCWTAPKDGVVDISGGAWKIRQSQKTFLTLWVKGEKLISDAPINGGSRNRYQFGQMINDQIRNLEGRREDFAEIIVNQASGSDALKNIAVKRGDKIYAQIRGADYTGLDLTIGKWDLAADFSEEKNPSGVWAYGEIAVDGQGQPVLELFESKADECTFDLALFGKGQSTWYSKTKPSHFSMMKSVCNMPVKPVVRYSTGPTVYTEALVDGQWGGRYWTANYHASWAYEIWHENAFGLEIDQELLATGWELVSANELPETDRGNRHFVVELKNKNRPVNVKVHTELDGTPIIKRWLEITNMSDTSMALDSVYPWTSKIMARSAYKDFGPDGIDHAFRLGYFENKGHRTEGWFEWKTLTEGITEMGCNEGQCFDEPFFVVRNASKGQYLICSLAWSANWHMEFDCKEHVSVGARWHDTLNFKIGPKSETPLCVIAAGETVKTPAVHMGYVSGDLDTTVQAMHEHVRHSVLPSRNKKRTALVP